MKFLAPFRHVVGTLSRFSSVLFSKSLTGRVPRHRWTLALLWLTALVPVRATEFYASPTGSGAGTLAAPMALTAAFTSSAIKPGDTLWLRGGTYQVGASRSVGSRRSPVQPARTSPSATITTSAPFSTGRW